MSSTTQMCNQFKADLLAMNVHAAGNTYKLALLRTGNTGTYGAGTISLGAAPLTGTGAPTTALLGTDAIHSGNSTMGTYDVSGFTLTGFSATLQGTNTGCLDFTAAAAATGTTISATGAVLYNSTQAAGKSLAVYDFGGTVASTAGTYTVSVPAVGAATSMIRIS